MEGCGNHISQSKALKEKNMYACGEGERVEYTSSGETGHQMEGWGCYPTVKSSEGELFLSEGMTGTKVEKSMRESRSNDRPKLGFSSRGGLL